jgi:hypothetical protein
MVHQLLVLDQSAVSRGPVAVDCSRRGLGPYGFGSNQQQQQLQQGGDASGFGNEAAGGAYGIGADVDGGLGVGDGGVGGQGGGQVVVSKPNVTTGRTANTAHKRRKQEATFVCPKGWLNFCVFFFSFPLTLLPFRFPSLSPPFHKN